MEKRPHPRILLLLLGFILGNIPQIFALDEPSCNVTQYLNEDLKKCCNRCPPGHHVKETCTEWTETVCQPCRDETFSAGWSYSSKCRKCYPCRLNQVEKEPCNATHDIVCDCPEGYTCAMRDSLNVCQFCVRTPPPPVPSSSPSMTTTTGPTELPPDMQNFWIIIVGVVSGMTLIMVLICLKTPLPRHLGCLIKKKRLPESTPQPETGVLFQPPQDYRGPASPLLEDAQITMPSQEEEKDLNYPIQASDENEIGEFAISK